MMNKIKYLLLAFVCCTFAGCMEYDDDDYNPDSRGNNAIVETKVISIAQLKSDYSQYVRKDYRDGTAYKQITDDIQLKGVVTGNDIQGNLYNEIALQDSTGAIIIAISEGGLCGYLPVGTEILVQLKGLYVGNYGLQAEVGTPYTNASGATYVSRMSRILWNSHFKYTGLTKQVKPEEFNYATWDLNRDDGKLAVLKNVEFNVSNDSTTWANPGSGSGSKSIYFKNLSNRVMVYTSNYADFAADFVPRGKVNVTGIMKRYNSSWQLIIRSIDDVEKAD